MRAPSIARDTLPNDFQLKLLDESGDNVWWFRRADFEFSKDWQRVVVKKRHMEFAWGPTRDRELRRAARLEIVIAAGKGGGRGSVAIDRLQLDALPVTPAVAHLPLRARRAVQLAGAGARPRWSDRHCCRAGRSAQAFDLASAPGASSVPRAELDASTHASSYDVDCLMTASVAPRQPMRNARGGRNAYDCGGGSAICAPDLRSGPQSRYESRGRRQRARLRRNVERRHLRDGSGVTSRSLSSRVRGEQA